MQLMQARRERKIAAAAAPSDAVATPRRAAASCARSPSVEALESLAYRFAIIGFIFWTFTLIAGSIWANDAWGRYWGFDTKEVWTFVIWVLYAGYIHARATRGWRGIALGLAVDHRLRRRAVQLHDREHVLQGPARLLRPELSPRAPRDRLRGGVLTDPTGGSSLCSG